MMIFSLVPGYRDRYDLKANRSYRCPVCFGYVDAEEQGVVACRRCGVCVHSETCCAMSFRYAWVGWSCLNCVRND